MTDLRDARVLVTGASGFLGANLVRALVAQGASVTGTIRPSSGLWRLESEQTRLNLEVVDVVDPEMVQAIVDRVRPEIVFHLAFPPGYPEQAEARSDMLRTGVLGTTALLESAARIGVSRFIQVGSSLEYGSKDRPLREQDPLQPGTFRGAVKAACSLLCRYYARQEGIPIVILRVFTAYGLWEPRSRLVPSAFLAALRDQSLPLTPPGIRHDLVYVADLVEACLRSATLAAEGCTELNIGSGRSWTNEAVVRLVQDIVGRKVRVLPNAYPLRPVDLDRRVADTSRAVKVLAWRPRFSLRQGLEQMYSWLKENQKYYDHALAGSGGH